MMKIENVSMEFVSFDAQDVITTSGGAEGLLMQVGVAAQYNEAQQDEKYKLKSYTGKIIGDGSTKTNWITFDPDDSITWASQASATQQKTEGVSYKEFSNGDYSVTVFESIVGWLKQQGIQ